MLWAPLSDGCMLIRDGPLNICHRRQFMLIKDGTLNIIAVRPWKDQAAIAVRPFKDFP